MTGAAAARRYATALFDVATRVGRVDQALADLKGLSEVVASHEELSRLFESPAVPPAKKKAVLDAIVARAGVGSVEVTRLAGLLAERNRLGLLGAVAEAFAARVDQSRNISAAEVVTAATLEPAGRAAIAAALERATGGEVRLSERVDPDLVGGMVARVGSLVFDGSVTRQLERLRQRLLAGG